MNFSWKQLETFINLFFTAIIVITLVSLGILSVYSGIQSGDLTLATLPLWIWNNGAIAYFFMSTVTCGHCLAQMITSSAFDEDKEKDQTKEEKADQAAGVLLVVALSGILWIAYWSFVVFYPLYKKLAEIRKESEKENDNG